MNEPMDLFNKSKDMYHEFIYNNCSYPTAVIINTHTAKVMSELHPLSRMITPKILELYGCRVFRTVDINENEFKFFVS